LEHYRHAHAFDYVAALQYVPAACVSSDPEPRDYDLLVDYDDDGEPRIP
jgi:hypothetical protein